MIMKKLLYIGLLSFALNTLVQPSFAAGQDIRDESGNTFMEETTPTPPATPPKNINIDLSNVGVPVDPRGHIVPMIDRDAPGGVRQNFSNLEVYSEPPINFIQTPGFNSFGQPFNAFAPPVPLVAPPYNNIGINLGRNFRLNLLTPNPYGYSPFGYSPYGFSPFGSPYGFSPYGGYGNAPVVGAAPFGIPGAPFGGATAPFSYGVQPFGIGGGPLGYPGLGYGGGPFAYPGLGFGAPFAYPGLGLGLGLGGGLGLGAPLVYSSPFGYGSPYGGSSVFSSQFRGLGLNLFLPNNVEWQSSSTFTPLTPNLDGPP